MDKGRATISSPHIISLDSIARFCSRMESMGRKEGTVEMYRRKLLALYDFLPEDKRLDGESLKKWFESLGGLYGSVNSVNVCISVINRYLDGIGRRDLQLRRLSPEARGNTDELTRVEYLRLLQGAKRQGRERLYLAIKVFVTLGLLPGELELFTVEAVSAGRVPRSDNAEEAYFPRCLRTEILEYCGRQGIRHGQIFRTRSGKDLNNSNLIKELKNLCEDIGIPREKGSPRALRKLYLSTRDQINSEVRKMVEANYEHLLETEQSIYGWELRNNI